MKLKRIIALSLSAASLALALTACGSSSSASDDAAQASGSSDAQTTVKLGEVVVTEEEPPHNAFTHKLCAQWERIACAAQSDRTRVCLLRTGVVLAPKGGILAKMLPPFRLGLGGPIGNGRQYMAWIHIDDMVNGILWLLDNDLRGPFNMVSPYPVRNEQFAHALGHALHRPAVLRVPATAIRLLMGESSVLVLGGQRALPKRLEASGFTFRWYDLEEALGDVVR